MNRATKLPLDPKEWTVEHIQLLNDLLSVLMYQLPLHGSLGQAAPTSEFLRDGMVAYADGSNWDPLSTGDKGLYRYNSGTSAWVYIG